MFGCPVCLHISVCCRTRRCSSGTRSRLAIQLFVVCTCLSTNLMTQSTREIGITNILSLQHPSTGRTPTQRPSNKNTPLQPVAPLLVYPDGQLPHVRLPAVLMHFRLLSHPPLLFRHSFRSSNKRVCLGAYVPSACCRPQPVVLRASVGYHLPRRLA